MDKLVKIGGYAQDKLDTAGGYGLETFYTLGFGIVSTLQNKNLKLALDLKKKKKILVKHERKKISYGDRENYHHFMLTCFAS